MSISSKSPHPFLPTQTTWYHTEVHKASLSHPPTQTTGSALKDKLLAWFLLALLEKGNPLYSDFPFEHLKGFYTHFILPSSKLL